MEGLSAYLLLFPCTVFSCALKIRLLVACIVLYQIFSVKCTPPFLYKKLSYDDALETQNLSLTAELFCSIISMYVEILKLREL
jgi:hypothetical protein